MKINTARTSLFAIALIYSSVGFASSKPYKFKSSKAPKIRVRIGKSLSKAYISGTDLKRELHTNRQIQHFPGRKSIHFNCQGLSRKPSGQKPVLLASVASPTGLITFDKERFRGQINVIAAPRHKSCDIVQETSIDDYLATLLSKEMNGTWPVEALKAQAIAARTYALYQMESQQVSKILGHNAHYDIESSEKHQVSGNFFDTTSSTLKAANETRGLVLLSKKSNRLAPAFFHAKCGGRTLRPDHVWANKVSGYESVPCPFCKKRGKKPWGNKISLKRFRKFLKWASRKGYLPSNFKVTNKQKLHIVEDKWSRFNLRIYIDDQPYILAKSVLRKYFGRVLIPSNNHVVSQKGQYVYLDGKGLGHGVGMCQIGALDLAKKGWSYKKILKHYFPGHRIARRY